MKKLAIWFASLSLLGLCAAGPALAATNYAVCVGVNDYKSSYCSNGLEGCVPDAQHMTNLITSRGEWLPANVQFIQNSGATRTNLRKAISNIAAKAQSGDHFLYYHSSHGGNDNYYFTTNSGKVYLHYGLDSNGVKNYICSYDADYTAKMMATDLSAFKAGVKIVVMMDTCHSAGMFKYNATTSSRKALAAKLAEAADAEDDSSDDGVVAEEPAPENSAAGFFMQAVLEQLEQIEADQVRRGLRPRTAASMATDVGWIAAADYDQYSWDGSSGGAFTEAFINGVTNKNKMCDNATYGNQDGYASFYEGWNYAKDQARGQRNYDAWDYDSDYGYYDYIWTDAQCTNTAVLNAVRVGWAGTNRPANVAPTFPSATATASGVVGSDVEYTFSASGSTPITYTLSTSVSSSLYDFQNGYLVFQPTAAGTYTFTCTAANGNTPNATCVLTVTVTEPPPATPEVPSTPPAASTTSFTATWSAVSDAASYNLYVEQKVAASSSTRASRAASTILSESFESDIPSTWTKSSSVAVATGKDGDGDSCVAFKGSGAYLITEAVDNPTGVSLMYKRSSNTTAWGLDISVGPSVDGPWTSVGTISSADTTWNTYETTFTASGTVYLKFTDTRSSGAAERYVDLIQVTGSSDTWVDIPGSPFTVSGTSKAVSGLSAGTEYRYSVAAVNAAGVESEPSPYVTVETAEGDSAPAITVPQTSYSVTVGAPDVDFTVTVTGTPAPTVTATCTEGAYFVFEENEFLFEPATVGTYHFVFTATNSEGSDSETVTIVVSAAPITVPVLTVTNITDTTALATWTACDGVSSYTLQLSTNDFAAASGASRSATPILSEDFAGFTGSGTTDISASLDDHTATPGWTGSKVYCNNGEAKVGASSGQPWLMTPAVAAPGTLRIVWTARRYGTGDQGTLLLGVSENGTDFTDETITLADEMTTYTNEFALAGSTAYVRWMGSGSSKARFYLDDVSITNPGGGDTPAGDDVQEFTVPGTSYEFTGLTPFTVYYARVKGNADWSNVAEFITEEETVTDTAPSWKATFPATATVNIGEFYTLANVSSYASGSPAPTITMAAPAGVEAELAGDTFTFAAEASGDYTFTFTAANGISPDATATLVVTAVGQAPVLTASQGTAVAAVVGDTVGFTVTATGIPAPTVAMAATEHDAIFENGEFAFAPTAVGTYDFTFTASNTEGTDTLTVTVTVTAAPVTVPELAVTNITDTTALATWTACDGVSSYTLQLSTNDFAAASGASRSATPILSEDFAGFTGSGTTDISASLDDHTATPGWTGSKVYCNNGEAKVGASSGQPWLMTPAVAAPGTLRIVWTARRYGTGDQGTLLLGVSENGTDFTDETITLADEMTTYTNEFALAGSTAYVRWMGSGSSKARFYLDDVSITNPGGGDTPAGDDVQEFTVPGTSYEFTGLTPFTVYYARVKGNADWSNVAEFITEEETVTDTAPSWKATFPATATVNIGEFYTLANVSSYASGSPAPTITMAAPAGVEAELAGDTFTFAAEASGDYTFTFTAANGISPDATATLVVTAVGQAPVLTASQGTSVAATVGDTVEFTVTATGIPAPTVTMAATEYDAVFENGGFAFAPDAAGTYAFTFNADNGEGTDTLVVTVTVSAAPVTIPTLTVDDITSTTALATWTACDGVSSYTLQLSTNDFPAASGTSRSATPILSEDFANFSGNGTADLGANGTLDDHTATAGWTGSKVYTASETVKVGASSGQGWLMTPALDASGTLTVVWSAYRYGTSDKNTLLLGVSENGTDFDEETITIGDEMAGYTNTFTVTGPTVYVRWMASSTSKARFYLDDVRITNPGGGDTPAGDDVQEFTVPGTSYEFTGLTPFTVYYARVKGNADWSNVAEFITEEETVTDTAPSWKATFPATATVNIGEFYTLANVSSYASGSPAPTITMAAPAGVEAELAGDTFTFAAEASGDYTFTFTAANGISPDATATLVVTAVGQAPVLTASQGTSVAATVGDTVEFTVTATGIPAPTVTMAATEYDAVFENGEFAFAPDAAGTYAFTFNADNGEGTDTLVVTVTVTAAPEPLSDYQQWLQDHGVATDTSADAVAPNGHTYGQNYAADIDPTSSDFLDLVVTDASSGQFTILNPSTNRYYQLLYTTDLTIPLESYETYNLGKGATSGTCPATGNWYGGLRATPTAP